MRSRWSVSVAVAAIVLTPLVGACGDDDDAPVDPTVTLFEETISPNVSTGATG